LKSACIHSGFGGILHQSDNTKISRQESVTQGADFCRDLLQFLDKVSIHAYTFVNHDKGVGIVSVYRCLQTAHFIF
jgi:hypothetical protein